VNVNYSHYLSVTFMTQTLKIAGTVHLTPEGEAMPEPSDPKIDRFYLVVGELIRAARGAARMTQAQLAEGANLTRSSIANIEAGRQRVPLHVFALIADALDVRPTRLLPEDWNSTPPPNISKLGLAEEEESTREFVENVLSQVIGDSGSKG
jgi:transcriptional regulator with XRE-family HTH domain